MSDVHRFLPRRDAARTEYLASGATAFVLVIAWLYLGRGERDPLLLVGLATGAAAVVMAGYFVRTRFQWVDEIRLSAEGVTLVSAGRPQTLPWTAVKEVKRFTRGGEQWMLSTRPGHLPLTIRSDGLTTEETARLRDLIPALHAAAQRTAEPATR